MRWFARKDWAVVIWSDGPMIPGEDSRSHRAIATQHYPQMNAATIKVGLSKKDAEREAQRLNHLNSRNRRAMRIADIYEGRPDA